MLNQILLHLHEPVELEKLYRSDKAQFRKSFLSVYPKVKGKIAADFWFERLKEESEPIHWGSRKELLWVVAGIFFAGFLAKIPEIFSIDEEFFYPRNISFIIFPVITLFFAWKNKCFPKINLILFGLTALSWIYINILPDTESDTLILACIHVPIVLWGILGAAYSGQNPENWNNRLNYLRFNGEAAVMAVLLGIAGGLLTGITLGLFNLIGVKIEEFYFSYVVAFGLPAIAILAAYLTHSNPELVNKVSPVIAKIFSPIVLIMLIIYLGAILITGKDPYNDREFLLIFNLLLVGVMGLIFFSVAEHSSKEKNGSGLWILFSLSLITVLVNSIALSAIVFRISEWGITPNRLAVLGSNILMLIHLLKVAFILYRSNIKGSVLPEVGKSIVNYLPVYFLWAFIVVFLFPILFGFS